MRKLTLMSFLLTIVFLNGCATTNTTTVETNLNTHSARVLAAATKANQVADRVIKRAGPLVLTGICIVQPQDCAAAKAAYSLALATHKEITVLIADLKDVNTAEKGTKLATLYEKFRSNIDACNTLVSQYGGTPLDMAEFDETVTEYQTLMAGSNQGSTTTTQ